jgi:putative peptidoglycan lipid II flippase
MNVPDAGVAPAERAKPGLARSAGLIGVATLTSRLLGLLRDQVLAYMFGAGNAMDAFNVAFRIPNLLRDLFAEGAMSAAFVPTFTRKLTSSGREGAWHLGNQVISALLVSTGAIVVLGIVFAYPLTHLFAAEYQQVPGKFELTVTLTRIMFPFLTLVAVAAAIMGMLNALDRFFVPALSPAMFNIATILCALLIAPVLPSAGVHPVVAVAIGAVLGGAGQVALQWPVLRHAGYRYRAMLNLRDPGLREVFVLMGPSIAGLAATQVNLFVNTVLATGQGTGAVSWLNYAFRVIYLPIGMFGVSVATAALPALSRDAAADALGGMTRTLSSGLRLMLTLNVPATAGLIALAAPIIELLFERGRFTPADTAATAQAVMLYSIGLIGYSTVKLTAPSFYALRDPRTPVMIGVITVTVNIILNFALVRLMGYRGLALGTALAATLNASLLLVLLRNRLGGIDARRVGTTFVKVALASAIMAVGAALAEHWLRTALPGGSILVRAVRVSSAIGAGLVILAAGARLLRIEEFDEALRRVRARLFRRGAG